MRPTTRTRELAGLRKVPAVPAFRHFNKGKGSRGWALAGRTPKPDKRQALTGGPPTGPFVQDQDGAGPSQSNVAPPNILNAGHSVRALARDIARIKVNFNPHSRSIRSVLGKWPTQVIRKSNNRSVCR